MTQVSSPCIARCKLDDDKICTGCYRHIDEISSWRHVEDTEREIYLARVEARRAKALEISTAS